MGDPVGLVSLIVTLTGHVLDFSKRERIPDSVRRELLEIHGQLGQVHQRAMGLSEAHAAKSNEVKKLTEEVEDLKEWDRKKAEYKLLPIPNTNPPAIVYRYIGSGETPHYICPHCYENTKREILQPRDFAYIHCLRCKAVFDAGLDPSDESGRPIRDQPLDDGYGPSEYGFG